ncbi:hypothetical protein V6948_00335 [Fusobacterium varium]|uniref:hypothetical protein n=1 Tax=Fusobacterium varium TaxID=856 RepID=UPI002FF382CD
MNQSERDKIAEAGEKIGDLAGALANSNDGGIFNTYKENRFGNLLNDYIKKSGVSGLFLDDKISLEDKRNALNNLVEGFLKDRGYTGPMPEIHIGSESFSVDSSKGIGEKIFISQDSLTSGDVLQILGHELGHLAKYDKDEKTADNVGNKIEEIKAGEEKDYNEYLASIRDKYKDLPSLEESKELENRIPDEYKEKFAVPVPLPVLVGGVVLIGGYYYIQNSEENKETWNKFQEDLRKEWESVKDKGIAYAEFQKVYMEAFLAKQNIIIGAEASIGNILQSPGELPGEAKIPIYLGGESPEVPKNNTHESPGTPPIPPVTNTAHDGGTKDLPDTGTLVNEPPKVEDNNILLC